ncbi:hypothetical protein [Pseudomonas nunensis]|uniref:hypothetical protein n=1 Tax=Pseudomonas nunensis TaxID=2961896 RepID=UPI0025B1D478|nr:hypothetical protein [Pseudomonas nunensis]MDN3220038.1 hypothetical protein [Pseudomonas nunensis]
MLVTYKLIPIPLHPGNPDQAPTSFDVRIVSSLEFSEGTATAIDVAEAIAVHPILARQAGQSISAIAVPLATWIASGKPATVTTGVAVTLTFAGATPLQVLRGVLENYLFRPNDTSVSVVRHDRRFDELREQDFLDINELHDDLWLLRTYVYASLSQKLEKTTTPTPDLLSYEQAKWMNSYAQSVALEAVFGDADGVKLFSDKDVSLAAMRLRDGVAKVQARLESVGAEHTLVAAVGLRSTSDAGQIPVAVSDPNVAIHAALKNTLLSDSCGITTSWRANADQPIIGDHVLFLQAASFAPTAYPLILQPTAFRRMGHTHPLSFADIPQAGTPVRTTNSALAYLNDEQGNPRYRATAINAETAVIQGTLLQFNNSLSNNANPVDSWEGDFTGVRDDRPPQLLADEHRGVNEPECTGLTISAPTADLATPDPLRDPQRETLWPCLFLEDLWIGFRLDLADGVEHSFSSVHQQVQEITFTASSRKIKGPVEDMFAKEQPSNSLAINSTEVIRYVGMSSAQSHDYLRFLGTESNIVIPVDAPFVTKVVGYSGATPLRFGRIYQYRLRNVLIGGVSLSMEGADALSLADSYVQSFPFFRARAYRPGELVSTSFNNTNNASRSVFLTSEVPRASAWLVPAPIDVDTARYHGVFLTKKSEPNSHAKRAFIQDVEKHFGRQPLDLNYFFDPDVAAAMIQVTVLNGDPDNTSHDFTYEQGAFCELAPHLHLKPIRVEYGRTGKWEEFRPIELKFSVSSDSQVQILKQGHTVRILVPVSADLMVSILPDVSEIQLRQTASYAASTAQLMLRSLPSFNVAPTIVPAVAVQRLRVTHCAKAPTTKPLVAGVSARFSPAGEPVVIAERARLKETADLPGFVQVDAASAGQVRLEAQWADINDNPQQDHPMLTAATAASHPRSIFFDRHIPPSASFMARAAMAKASLFTDVLGHVQGAFGLQCAENKVFLGRFPEQAPSHIKKACTVNFADARRKCATVTVVTTSRYKDQFKAGPASAFETLSEKILVDVPASMRLPAPEISHIVPLSRDLEQFVGSTSRTQRIYAMRIYVRPPWFLSGPGERLAIGCVAGPAAPGPIASLDKFITQWGEDPLERPHLDVTRNAPRASNFETPEDGNYTPLDHTFYPQRSIEGTRDVLYRDNLQVFDATPTKRTISVASFALRRDPASRLWFCDVSVTGGFLGWCGLALYRHQLHSHEELQLSAMPAWVYGAVLHGEPIFCVQRAEKLHVTVGPVFDPNVSFELDSRPYFRGISRNLTKAPDTHVTLKQYDTEGRSYFEGIVRVEDGPWSLVKRRFGSEVASIGLHIGS